MWKSRYNTPSNYFGTYSTLNYDHVDARHRLMRLYISIHSVCPGCENRVLKPFHARKCNNDFFKKVDECYEIQVMAKEQEKMFAESRSRMR